MANDFDPNALGNAAGKASESMQELLSSLKNVYNSLSNTFGGQSINNINKFVDEFANDMKGATKSISDMKDHLQDINKFTAFEVAFDKDKPIGAINDLMLKFTELGSFVSNAKMFDKFSKDGTLAINSITDSITGAQEGLKRLGVGNIDIEKYTRVFANADQAEGLEKKYMDMAASTGTLNDLYDKQTNTIKDLSGLTAEYTDMIGRVASSTQLGVPITSEFAAALGKVPHVLDQYITTAGGSVDKTIGLQAAMQLMSGTGRSQEEVIKALDMAYEKLSTDQGKITNSAQKGMEMFALMSQVANTLDLRFSDVSNTLSNIADKFEFVGNETEGAAHMLERYTGALRETGLTAPAAVAVVNTMADSLGKLSMGTKAFISARSGGPGGLQGAFRVEEMMREGKMDQVSKMIEQTLKQQFGGKIYNLKEASQSPEAASQFMKQRSMLMSGAFGSLTGGDQDKATRLLEAFGKGSLEASKEIKSGQAALTQATQKGISQQERYSNLIKEGNILAQRSAMANEISAGALVRLTFGSKGAAAPAMRERAEELRRSAGFNMDAENNMRKTGVGENDWQKGVITAQRKTLGEAGSLAGDLTKILGDLGKKGVSAVGDIAGDIKELGGNQKQTTIPMSMPHKDGVFQQAVHNMPNHTAMQSHTAAAVQAATTQHQAQKKAEGENIQKVELTITAPPGFDVKTKRQDANLIIKHINQQSRVPNPSDPGY